MEANNGRKYRKPRKRKARPAVESKERASVQKQHLGIIPRDVQDCLFAFGCAAAFFGIPCILSLLMQAGVV